MRVVLIGNYEADRQESMLRYADLLRAGLADAGHEVTLVSPRLTLRAAGPHGVRKWIGYVDKYILSPRQLAHVTRRADVVHVCDHSNAVYVPSKPSVPYVATCHDLIAVRGALGEISDWPTGFTGRQLQRAILSGLRRAHAVACVSVATLKDARRLMNGYAGNLVVVPNSLNYPYRKLEPGETRRRLEEEGLPDPGKYVLSVGASHPRKNRECILQALAHLSSGWAGYAVFAGLPLTEEQHALARRLGVHARIVEVPKPSNERLEALYNGALALLFPSRFEGFGWPLIEAQACACPVIASDREPMPEVSGGAAIFCDADDAEAFARAIETLAREEARREDLIRRGLQNAARFSRPAMIGQFVSLYEKVAGGDV